MKIIGALVGVGLLVVGCGPSIDPAAKADIDARVQALTAPKQSATFPAPTVFQPMPFAVGQWLKIKLVDDKGQPSFMTQKITGQEGDAYWFEMLTETYQGKSAVKILMAVANRTDPNTIDIRGGAMKDKNGNVTVFEGPLLSMMRGTYKEMMATMVISWQGLPQEDAAVPGGSFAQCFKTRTDVAWGPWRSATTSWSHPAVPISGMVKAVGIDKPTTMDLVDFGLTGATAEF
jgi:hypothetical protein